jgi:energy-coupling factor transporter ATP-binding protein EcfA2
MTHATYEQNDEETFYARQQMYPPHVSLLNVVTSNIDRNRNNMIITGPNASGKTTFIKMFAINIILSQQIGQCSLNRFTNIHPYVNIPDTSERDCLTAETVQCATLSLKSMDDIKSSDGLPARVLGVGDCLTDEVFKVDFQDASGLLVNEARDTLDTTSACKTSDGWLRYALDVVSEDLSVSLGTTFA